jgi:putative SOS response-associated peptidase YedK
MCGRFALFAAGDEIAERFQLVEAPLFDPRYNITPTQSIAAVQATPAGRALNMLRWGLIPSWAAESTHGVSEREGLRGCGSYRRNPGTIAATTYPPAFFCPFPPLF